MNAVSAAPVQNLPTPSFAQFLQAPEEVGPPKSIFLYGMPGTWKSSIAGSIAQVPGIKKVLYIDTDGGSEVLATNPAVRDGSMQILPINPLDTNAFAKTNATIDEVCKTDFGYDAVVFDALDVSQDTVEKHFKAVYAAAGSNGKKDGFAIWGDIGVWTDEIVRKLHNAPHFVAIIICHAKEQTSESGAYRILPKLSGSSKENIASIPSIVAYLSFMENPETGTRHNVAVVGESEKTTTKNRYSLPSNIVDLTMPKLYAMIEASTKVASEPDRKTTAAPTQSAVAA